MNQKINIVNDLIQINEKRFINYSNVVLISKILNGSKSKLAFNFENIVSTSQTNIFVPEFHYVFEEQDTINDLFSFLAFKLKDVGFIEIKTSGGKKLVNKKKINSFYIDEDNCGVFLNLNSSITGITDNDTSVTSLSTRCSCDNTNELYDLVNLLIQ